MSETRTALVVLFDRPLSPIHADGEFISTEFYPIPRDFYSELKDEVKSQEQLVNEHYWFFQDVGRPDDIKERIEEESDLDDVGMRHSRPS